MPPTAPADMLGDSQGMPAPEQADVHDHSHDMPAPESPEGEPYAAGQVQIVARVCTDDNADRLCGLGEGDAGLPVYVLDADTGDRLVSGLTNVEGRAVLAFPLAQESRLSINIPYLGLTQQASPRDRGADIVLQSYLLPEVLP